MLIVYDTKEPKTEKPIKSKTKVEQRKHKKYVIQILKKNSTCSQYIVNI